MPHRLLRRKFDGGGEKIGAEELKVDGGLAIALFYPRLIGTFPGKVFLFLPLLP